MSPQTVCESDPPREPVQGWALPCFANFRPFHLKGVRGVGFEPTNPKGMGSPVRVPTSRDLKSHVFNTKKVFLTRLNNPRI
jgi:hypothetical protein